jgi:UTP-glucose-1-phosphate uridylyltransferase
MSDLHIVVLAAGKGTRMKSSRPKVLHRVAGAPMIEYVLTTAHQLSPRSITVVVGHQADVLTAALAQHSSLKVVVQEPQLGTGDALRTAESVLKGTTGTLILLSGDEVGKVVLLLGVVGPETAHGIEQSGQGERVDAGVDLANLALGRAGVLLLDNACNPLAGLPEGSGA